MQGKILTFFAGGQLDHQINGPHMTLVVCLYHVRLKDHDDFQYHYGLYNWENRNLPMLSDFKKYTKQLQINRLR